MANFPFFRFPYHNYYYPYYHNYNKPNTSNKNKHDNIINLEPQENTKENRIVNLGIKNKTSKYNSFGPIRFVNPFLENNSNEPILEILGIELYLDDIIILGLLFFLYKEEVQDEMLFLSLILLLLT